MKPYSMDLRARVIEAIDDGETEAEAANVFGVSDRTIRNWRRLREETGSIAPRPHAGGTPRTIGDEDESRVRAYVEQHSDATLQEIAKACGLRTSAKTICVTLQRLKLTRKKKVRRAAERDDPEVRKQREEWKQKTSTVDAGKMVVVDETGVTTQMHRTYGRAPRGERVVGVVPERHYRSATLMGGMRIDGSTAALVYEGGTDVSAALAFVKTQLAPLLHPGDIVMWDNLAAHKSRLVIQAVEETGATVWPLPPYSPDLSPIEKLWSKVKTSLRSAAARSCTALVSAIRKALKAVTPIDIEHWFEHAGYRKMRR